MGRINKAFAFILCIMSITCGCKIEANTKMLKANKTIEVFKSFENDQQQIIFYLNPGDQCTIGRKKVAKIYAYYEVMCPGRGNGWVALGDGYDIIEMKRK